MTYYKVICGDEFIGVATTDDLRKYQAKHRIVIFSDESSAQFIQIGDALYRDEWFLPCDAEVQYEDAKVITVDQTEYDALFKAIEADEEIIIQNEDEDNTPEEVVESNPDDVITVEYAKSKKISEMSKACENKIIDGVDVMLSDGETRHFSLTITDQLNLLTLSALATTNGAVPYHADGELCRYYSAADINTIVGVATQHKTYNTTYFNALQGYIKSMDDIVEISNVYYGMDIPYEFRSEILNDLIG